MGIDSTPHAITAITFLASSARVARVRATGPFWYGKWSRNGRPVIRALGRAWVEPDGNGGWHRKRGRPPDRALTEAEAAEMLALAREHDAEQALLERNAEERRRRGVTFRELAGEYLAWLTGGIDLPNVKAAMGHSHITTTERYLHARPAGELADRFTRAFGGVPTLSAA